MSTLLFLVGLVGLLVCLVLLVLAFIRKKEKKKILIGLGICFVVFVIGICIAPPDSTQTDTETTKTVAETENTDNKAEKETEEKEPEEQNKKAETAEKKVEKEAESKKQAEKATEEKTDNEKAEKEKAEQKADTSTVPLSKAVSRVEKTVSKTYGSNCKVDYDETTATINLWPEGVGDEAFAAANGDESSYKAWNKRVSKARKLSADMHEKLANDGYPGMSVIVNLQNDLSQENTLLTVKDETVTYNWVNEEKKNQTSQETAAAESEIIVYLPEDGDCYHDEDCRTLKDYKQPVTLDEAIKMGYRPCGICEPPTK